jgi:P27 family predicted phage terminase small subunit
MKKSKPKPPETLSDEAAGWWKRIIETFEVDDPAGYLLLGTALEAFDDLRAAQAILEKDGPIIQDRWGQKRQHPATLVLRDSRNLMLRSLKALNLDITAGAPLGGK